MIGILLILTGSTWFYLQAHTDNGFVIGFSSLLIIAGWICIFEHLIFNDEKSKLPAIFIYLLIGVLPVANILFIGVQVSNKVSTILNSEPTRLTIGTITEIKKRYRRITTDEYAILTYSTPDKKEYMEINNHKNHYVVGQQFEIEYSIDNPEIARIKREIIKNEFPKFLFHPQKHGNDLIPVK